jgi:DNA-binding GntR family transcriptional regulator
MTALDAWKAMAKAHIGASGAKPKHTSRLLDVIEFDIASGRMRPGERLDEISLATRFGVSRTPIREALQHLAAAGLAEIRPHRGAVVASADPRRLIEMFELMAELEAFAGRLAARRLDDADRAHIVETHELCRKDAEAGHSDAYYNENERFHQAIYRASRSGFLAEQATALQRRLSPYRRLQLRSRNRVAASIGEHQAIVDGIIAGDEEATARLLRAHVIVQGENFSDLLASLGESPRAYELR